jgi:cysteine desulfurase
MARLESIGRPVKRLAVDRSGLINPEQIAFLAEQAKVGLISVQLANNEVGTVQPLTELATYFGPGAERPSLHVDAVQALGRLPLDLGSELRHVDLCSLSLHKIGGPLGVGVLMRRRGVPMAAHLFGGGQEEGLRPGTENPAAIGAAALAIELAVGEQAHVERSLRALTRELHTELLQALPDLQLLGPPIEDERARLPNTLCLSLPNQDARMLVTRLDMLGVEVSAGSACSSGAVEASHVLLAMGLDEQAARTGLRLSLGRNTTRSDCKRAVDVLVKVISLSLATHDNGADL